MNNKKRQVQRNMIITYAVSGIVLTGILSFLSSRIISNFLVDRSVDYARQSLDVSYQSATTMLDDLTSEFYFLFNQQNQVVQYKNEGNNIEEVVMLFQQTTLSDQLVDFISLYNVEKNEFVLSNNATGSQASLQNNEYVQSLMTLKENYKTNNSKIFYHQQLNGKNMLSMVFANKDANNAISYFMVVNVDEQVLSSMFTPSEAEHEVLIVNDNNVVIADSSQRYLGELFDSGQRFSNPMTLDERVNYFVSTFENQESLIAFKKSLPYAFVFFHITPYDSIQQTIVQANRNLVWLFLGFALANILVSLYATRRFYTPIQQIMDQFVNKEYNKAKNEFELIESAFTDLNLNNQINVLRQLFLTGKCNQDCDSTFLKFPLYVVVIKTDQSISEKIKEQIDPIWPFIQIDEGVFAGVIAKEKVDDVSYESFDGVFGLSQEVRNVDQVRKNYRYALAAAQFTETLEDKKVMFYDEIYKSDYLTPKSVLHQDILNYVNEHGLSEEFTAEAMADELGFSLGYIRQVFKEQENVSLNEFVIVHRIEKAKEMLLNTDLSGREISEAIGYSDNRYFYTQFKQRIHMTIEEFRQQSKESE